LDEKSLPSAVDFKPALRVRKNKVLAALRFLVLHNELYRDVRINHPLLDSWADDFVPPEIENNITYVTDADHHEREGYTASLQEGNHENDFASAQDTAINIDSNEPLLTGSIMTDVNGERSRSDSRTLDTQESRTCNRHFPHIRTLFRRCGGHS
jgi:hypothetical protein